MIKVILSIIISIIIILSVYLYKREKFNSLADLPADLLGFPVRYFNALKSAFDNLKLYIGYIPIGHKECAPYYNEYPLTCTKGCGGYYNLTWGAEWCNGPKQQGACGWAGCWGWHDCYKTWIVDCFNQPAHTYDREPICRGTDEAKAGLCYPKGYL